MLVVVCPLSDGMLILALPLSGSNEHGVKMVTLNSVQGVDPEDWAIVSSGLAHSSSRSLHGEFVPLSNRYRCVCVCV